MADEICSVAIEAARRGAEVLERYFGDKTLVAEDKAHNDYVSRADRESEEAVVEVIRGAFPSHAVLGEEGGESLGDAASEYRWIVDPLDGTTNFLRGVPYFCISIACQRRGETVAGVVLDPIRDDLFVASRGAGASRNGAPIQVREQALEGALLATGFPFKAHPALDTYLAIFRDLFLEVSAIRRCGAAALDLAYTACGIYDGFFEFCLQPWDLAAGALLIQEAGGAVSDLDGGDRYLVGGSLLAGTHAVVDGLCAVVARHTSEAHLGSLFAD